MNELLTALLDALAPALQFLYVLPRLGTLFLLFPMIGVKAFPIRIRMGVALVLSLAVGPTILPPAPPSDLPALASFVGGEVATGAVLGTATRVVLAVVEGASGILANLAGFAIASQLDPLTGETSLVPTTFHALLGTALFFAADLHHLMLKALIDSFTLLPSTDLLSVLSGSVDSGARLGKMFFDLSLSLAAPAVLLTLTTDMIMLLAGKAMPQAPILLIAYPFKVGLGLVAMAVLSVSLGHGISTIAEALVGTLSLLPDGT